ncbi:class I SAM-dependent methyltransferase [Brachyspira murdochii]|uniref:class I SAM-dependent methyltransferase n=1 Tax=Brachyspira murdochii TaxID=84378 RepID=UPI0012F4CEDB|nr:class I SAM-dependent methyltransferase [Brachyspira murdochii]
MDLYNLLCNKYELKGRKFRDEIIKYQSMYHSLMTLNQMEFIMSLIYENKFNNVLEIGIFNGVSSLGILKAGIRSNKDFQLYSIDLGKDSNFFGKAAMELCTEDEKEHYNLFLGKTSSDINDIISNNIKFDLVFIDGKHSHPSPLFDLLYVIPYLTPNGVIVLHDIIDISRFVPNDYGGSYLFESWSYDKYRVYDYDNKKFSYMGCIFIHNNLEELKNNILLLANIQFEADPWMLNIYNDNTLKVGNYKETNYALGFNEVYINKLIDYIGKYICDKNFIDKLYSTLMKNYNNYISQWPMHINKSRNLYFLHSMSVHYYDRINTTNDFNTMKNIIIRLVNNIAWWIPVKKWRDNFRNKILYGQNRTEQNRTEQNSNI